MDAVYEINVAKTEFREAYNSGDVSRLMSGDQRKRERS